MKVHIGPYKNWFGPYQLAEALCFWVKPEIDEYGFERKPKWVHDFGEWLAHGEVEPEQELGVPTSWDRERHNTWLYKLLLWIDSKKKRKISVRIDRWDTWSMDRTLAYIVLPMLKQLKATKHGAPFVDDEDVPEELRSTSAPPKENEYHTDENHFKRWDWAMNEMIFAFEHLLDDSWEEKYRSGKHDFLTVKEEKNGSVVYRMVTGPNDTYKCDYDGIDAVNKRIDNGFRLFGKYYRGLWD